MRVNGSCVTYISIGETEMEISGWMRSIFLKNIYVGLAGEFDMKVQRGNNDFS